jgi:hypothetical protein
MDEVHKPSNSKRNAVLCVLFQYEQYFNIRSGSDRVTLKQVHWFGACNALKYGIRYFHYYFFLLPSLCSVNALNTKRC